MAVQEAVMAKGYDKLSLDYGLLLALPFREGTGVITRDVAMPHHELTLQDPDGGSFAWGNLVTGCPYLQFTTVGFGPTDGVYLDCPAANTVDLDFTTGDYSIVVWVKHEAIGELKPKIVVGRYVIDDITLINNVGWEVYLETNGPHYLELRHHHGSIGVQRDGCYSTGWAPGGWELLGITRSGLYPKHYRNATSLAVTYGGSGMRDPDSANQDLVIGARFSKNADWYNGQMWNLRIWDRELSNEEMHWIFEMERHWFNV